MEPKELEKQLGAENLLVVDVSRSEIYDQGHIPGAAHIDYAQIIAARPPAMGELPSEPQLSDVFSSIGMRPENHVVAYDNEGGGRASPLSRRPNCAQPFGSFFFSSPRYATTRCREPCAVR